MQAQARRRDLTGHHQPIARPLGTAPATSGFDRAVRVDMHPTPGGRGPWRGTPTCNSNGSPIPFPCRSGDCLTPPNQPDDTHTPGRLRLKRVEGEHYGQRPRRSVQIQGLVGNYKPHCGITACWMNLAEVVPVVLGGGRHDLLTLSERRLCSSQEPLTTSWKLNISSRSLAQRRRAI